MKNTPLISIIIPVYNGSNYLAEAIDCALGQTYENIEVIVVNDGSSDEGKTEEIALSYGDRIHYISKENGGVSSALNLGIKNMKGKYFSWLSHDDKYLPHKVKDSVDLLGKYGFDEKLIAYTNVGFINEKSECVNHKEIIRFETEKEVSNENCMKSMLQYGAINGCALLVPKNAFEESGLFDEDLRYCQDVLMWHRIFAKGYKIISDGKKNVLSRLHSNQVTQTRRDLLLSDSLAINEELMNIFSEQENSKELMYLHIIRSAKNNLFPVTKQCLKVNKEKKYFRYFEICKISGFVIYGKFRILLKKIYYKLVYSIDIK